MFPTSCLERESPIKNELRHDVFSLMDVESFGADALTAGSTMSTWLSVY